MFVYLVVCLCASESDVRERVITKSLAYISGK